jgi:uncharacterized Zn finger protein
MAEEVTRLARRGALDGNPRLLNRVACPKCGCADKTFLEFLKSGEFDVEEKVTVVVSYPGGAYLYVYEQETVTPILLRTKCRRCGHESKVTDPVLTLEYLHGIAKCGKPGIVPV